MSDQKVAMSGHRTAIRGHGAVMSGNEWPRGGKDERAATRWQTGDMKRLYLLIGQLHERLLDGHGADCGHDWPQHTSSHLMAIAHEQLWVGMANK